jgi:hypothetical protein
MALTKVTKHVVYGSMIVQHMSDDLSDASGSSGWWNWGQSLTITPQYADSHLEIVLTGSVFTGTASTTSDQYGHIRFMVNGQEEYIYEQAFSTPRGGHSGHQRLFNPRFNQHATQQDWNAYQTGSGVYMTHIHAPGTTNAQTVQVQAYSTGHYNWSTVDGFLTLTEISGDHHNIT